MRRTILLTLAVLCLSSSLVAQLAKYDVGLRNISSKSWGRTGEGVTITGEFTNLGTEVLNSVNVNWVIESHDPHVYEMRGLNLSKSHNENFVHPINVPLWGDEDIVVKVWVSHPNGQQDEKARNDTLYRTIQIIKEFPEKKILLEEFTGAWCGWCPRGPITYRDVIQPANPNVILAALHNGDDMVTTDGNTVVSAFAAGFPTGMIDRKPIGGNPIPLSTTAWMPCINEMDKEFTPAAINVYNYYWPDTYEWKIEVVVDFIMDYSGDLRLNCIILEDSVTGSGSGYNQSNYYDTRNDYAELQGAGNPIVGYQHNHVVREMIGGAWGKTGIIPKNVKRGDRYIYSKIIKPKSGWDMRQIRLVGVLQAYNSNVNARPILNVAETELHMATGYELSDISTDISIFPNPVSDLLTIDLGNKPSNGSRIELLNLNGQVIFDKDLSEHDNLVHQINMKDFMPGIYFLRLIDKKRPQTIKVIRQ